MNEQERLSLIERMDNERPIVVRPSIAKEIGLNEAIILQQLMYWLSKSSNMRDGKTWVYKTYDEWAEEFPFWSVSTIRRAIKSLRDMGLVETTDEYNKMQIDNTLWYTIPDHPVNRPSVQNEQTHLFKLNTPITIDYTETTFIEDRKRLTPGERDRASEAVLNALRDKYKANPLGSIRSRVDMERRLDEHVDLIEQYGFEEYIRALNAAIPYKDVRYASNIEAQIVRDANAAPPKLNPSEERRGVVNLQFKN